MSAFYAEELKYIADIADAYHDFYQKLSALKRPDSIDYELDGDMSITIFSEFGKLGRVGWTEAGEIGFTVAEPESNKENPE